MDPPHVVMRVSRPKSRYHPSWGSSVLQRIGTSWTFRAHCATVLLCTASSIRHEPSRKGGTGSAYLVCRRGLMVKTFRQCNHHGTCSCRVNAGLSGACRCSPRGVMDAGKNVLEMQAHLPLKDGALRYLRGIIEVHAYLLSS